MKMWVMNLGKAVEVPKLNEAMAIELGATLLGEFIIFTCGAVLVVAEVVRRQNKEAAMEQARLDELQAITDRLRDLEIESSRQDAQLREITRLCMALQGSPKVKEKNFPGTAFGGLENDPGGSYNWWWEGDPPTMIRASPFPPSVSLFPLHVM